MAEHERFLDGKVAVSTMKIVMDYKNNEKNKKQNKSLRTVTTTEASLCYANLGLVVGWWPQETVFDTKVTGSMKDD